MASVLLSERRGAAQVLTISDPATRNTLSPQVYEAGSRALQAAAAEVRVDPVDAGGDRRQAHDPLQRRSRLPASAVASASASRAARATVRL